MLACAGPAADSGGECDREPPLTWSNFGQAWMNKHCNGCHGSLAVGDARHGAPESTNLDTWDDALRHAERVAARSLGDAPDMPPGGGPSEEERALLAEWLHCAAGVDGLTP